MEKFFIYSCPATTITNGETASISLTIGNEPFIVKKILVNPSNANVLVNLRITSKGYDLISNNIPSILIGGADNKYLEIDNLKIEARDTILISVENNSGANITFSIALVGFKIS